MTEIAIAYDVEGEAQALDLDTVLGEGPELAKIGLQLFTAAGPSIVRSLRARGRRVFLDLKLHDIPNTVRGAAASAAMLDVDFMTLHALGGAEMIAAAADGVRSQNGSTRLVAVTLLTSLDTNDLPPGFGRPFDLHRTQAEWLAMAESAGAHGIVCSASDLSGIRRHHPAPFFAVTPGIRPAGGAHDDQRRVTTVSEAVRLGAGMIVIGRPVTGARDPRAALQQIHDELGEAATTST
jgi:orotidine-5'-phosphate decarboxylase